MQLRRVLLSCLSFLRSVLDGGRYTFVGVVTNVRSRTYSGGNMLMFDVEDETGALGAVVWDDIYAVYNDVIKNGVSFKFVSVLVKANPRNDSRLELKLYNDTRLERCIDVTVEYTYTSIDAAKQKTTGSAHIKAVVGDMSDDVETSRSSETMRRGIVVDSTGELPVFLVGEAAVKTPLAKGCVAKMDGNMSSNGCLFVTKATMTSDPELESFWGTLTDAPQLKKPRVEPTISCIADIKSADVGARGSFDCVVRSRSAIAAPLNNDRVKYTFVLVDPSMGAVEVGLFVNKNDTPPDADVGDSVSVTGTVSSYNTRSLTTNSVVKTDDTKLREWFSTLGDDSVFDDISVDSRETAAGIATADA